MSKRTITPADEELIHDLVNVFLTSPEMDAALRKVAALDILANVISYQVAQNVSVNIGLNFAMNILRNQYDIPAMPAEVRERMIRDISAVFSNGIRSFVEKAAGESPSSEGASLH